MVQTLQENVLDVQNLLDDLQTTPAAMPASATPLSSFMAQQPGTQAGSRLSQHTTASFESWSNLRDTSRTTVTMRFQGHIAAFATQARPSSRTSHGTPYNGLVPRKTRLGT
ncbi:uncharacterized protein SPSK_04693 [Sporothrix schenckii 1099-18]|uniref:Uncharacterized protein n=1 Tax=Sporothrix schenckii 1099-18 TaxID=1397361 RepID=A0A0F2M577_SPOSC|nr:uncharacterized protein SPSK_04693 [Sporothrix schenckii 1099-18]KJR83346.1 hypothetical protein SPSK_04693 [Sporothrix schenckii 1099-18]